MAQSRIETFWLFLRQMALSGAAESLVFVIFLSKKWEKRSFLADTI